VRERERGKEREGGCKGFNSREGLLVVGK